MRIKNKKSLCFFLKFKNDNRKFSNITPKTNRIQLNPHKKDIT